MILLSSPNLRERLGKEWKKYKRMKEFHLSAQKQIDFVLENKWLNRQPCKIWYHTDSLFGNKLIFNVQNVDIEKFIENVLGPFHLKFDKLWHLELSGDEEEPVFEFSDNSSPLWAKSVFFVKEGEFRQCTVVKEFSHVREGNPEPVYRLRLVCE